MINPTRSASLLYFFKHNSQIFLATVEFSVKEMDMSSPQKLAKTEYEEHQVVSATSKKNIDNISQTKFLSQKSTLPEHLFKIF